MNNEARRRFLAACALDHQALSGLIEDARDLLGDLEESQLRGIVMGLISDLLREGLIEAGVPDGMENPTIKELRAQDLDQELLDFAHREPREWPFHPWGGDVGAVIERITRALGAFHGEPLENEVCWFRATSKGRLAAKHART